jgi:hypothetical protein
VVRPWRWAWAGEEWDNPRGGGGGLYQGLFERGGLKAGDTPQRNGTTETPRVGKTFYLNASSRAFGANPLFRARFGP